MNALLVSRISLVVFFGLNACRKPELATPERAMPVDLVQPSLQASYQVKEFALGRVEAARHSELGFELPGTLTEVLKDEGQAVVKGEAIATIDTARLEARKREAVAAVEQSKALQSLAEATLERTDGARRSGAVSAQKLDQAIQQRDTASASVRRSQAELDRVEVDLDKSILRAPYDGIVARRLADPGSAVGAGQPILTLLESSQLEIRAGLPGNTGVKEGDRLEWFSNRERLGEAVVKRVLPALNASVRTVDVILSPTSSEGLRDGDLIEIGHTKQIDEPGFWIPFSALGESHRGLWAGYLAVRDEEGNLRADRLSLEILHLEEERAYVRGPLPEPAHMITRGLHRIVPGQLVTDADAVAEDQNTASNP